MLTRSKSGVPPTWIRTASALSSVSRLAAAHVPWGTAFATKPTPAVEMIERAITADMPFAWVAADAVYRVGDIEQALRRAGKGYVLGVKSDHRFGSWKDKPVVAGTAVQIASDLDPGTWRRLSAGNGTKGARLHDCPYLELADLEADEHADGLPGTWTIERQALAPIRRR